jgi:glycosyltransferase involved in cell wall biosynthesis
MPIDNKITEIRKLIEAGELEKAELALSDAIKQDPGARDLLALQAELHLKKGSALWEKGDVDEALDYLTKALEINPSDRTIVLKCGEVLTDLQQHESAADLYSSYLQKHPDDQGVTDELETIKRTSPVQQLEELGEIPLPGEKSDIRVSAIVSTYNSERFIRGCLEDLVNQTLYQKGGLEIIVIDSGSEQNERSVVEEYQKQYKNIVYTRTERETVYAAWNRGIKLATGEYITNANADDRHRNDALEKMASLLDQNPAIGLVYADVVITSTENETFGNHTPAGAYRWLDYSKELLTLGCFIGPQPMWRKSLHDRFGYFDESFTSSGDWEFWLRISKGTQMFHIPEFLGLYFYSPQSAEHRDPQLRINEDSRIFNRYIPRYLATMEDIDRGLAIVNMLEQKHGDVRQFASIKNNLMLLKSRHSQNLMAKGKSGIEPPGSQGFTAIKPLRKESLFQIAQNRTAMEQQKNFASIILLASDRQEDFRKCLKSIKAHTQDPHEIIVVPLDSNTTSLKWVKKFFRKHPGDRTVENRGKLNYAKAGNIGIREASGEYVVVIDDSVMVTDGWLSGMTECLTSASDMGLVGPMMNDCEGPQGVKKIAAPFGLAMTNQENTPHDRKTKAIRGDSSRLMETPEYAKSFRERNRHRRVPVKKLQGFCLLISRAVCEKTGVFDEQFAMPEYAVEDYCLRAVMAGYRNLIAGDVFVYHKNSKNLSGPEIIRKIIFAHNKVLFSDRKRFNDKWSGIDTNSETGKSLLAVNALNLSDEMIQKGNTQNALSALIEGIQAAPGDTRLHYALIEILIGQRNFQVALDIFGKMPEKMKQGAKALELLGYCKEGLGLLDEAGRLADEAISLNSTSANLWNLKGFIALKQGRPADAEKSFSNAIAYDPGFGETYANLGALRWNTARHEEALNLFERAFLLSTGIESVLGNFHAAASSLSQLARAEAALKDAAAIYPLNKKIHYTLVDVLLQEEKYQEAMSVFEDAIIEFGIDDDTLALALGIRDKIGPKEIATHPSDARNDILSSRHCEERSDEAISRSSKIATPSGLAMTNDKNTINIQGKGPRDDKEKSVIARSETTRQSHVRTDTQTTRSPRSARDDSTLPAISLCMIVKNEEKNIAKCLHSIAPLADEMIVVDTGSTDRTKDIARAFGAKVYDFPWTGSFSEARNFSLSKASGGWHLILDADEVISPFDQDILKDVVKKSVAGSAAFSIPTRNYVVPVTTVGWKANDGSYSKEEVGTGWYPSEKVRLFPNRPGIRFENPVHEFVDMSITRSGIRILHIDVPIHHYGKLDKEKTLSKGEEYYTLGKTKLAEKGEQDFIAVYELAMQATELERYDEALEYWRKLSEIDPSYAKAYFGIGNSLYRMGKFQEALDAIERAMRLERPDSNELKEMVNLYASCAICFGKPELAIPFLEGILKDNPSYPMAMVMFAMANICAGEKRKWPEYLQPLKNMNYNYMNHFYDFAQFLTFSGKNPRCALLLIDAVSEAGEADERFFSLREECEKMLRTGDIEA